MIGIDAITESGYEEQKSAFLRHIADVRFLISKCPLFLAVESNLGGHAAQQHYVWLKERNLDVGVILLKESSQRGLPGIWTSPYLKTVMKDDLHIALKRGILGISRSVAGEKPMVDLEELRNQLLRYSKFPIPQKSPGGVPKYALSGKGASCNMNDDLAMALMINNSMAITVSSPSGCVKYGTRNLVSKEPLGD